MTTWRMHIVCWIPNATDTNTHSEYVTLFPFPLPHWLHERTLMLRHKYVFRLVLILKQSNRCVWLLEYFCKCRHSRDSQRHALTNTERYLVSVSNLLTGGFSKLISLMIREVSTANILTF